MKHSSEGDKRGNIRTREEGTRDFIGIRRDKNTRQTDSTTLNCEHTNVRGGSPGRYIGLSLSNTLSQ